MSNRLLPFILFGDILNFIFRNDNIFIIIEVVYYFVLDFVNFNFCNIFYKIYLIAIPFSNLELLSFLVFFVVTYVL